MKSTDKEIIETITANAKLFNELSENAADYAAKQGAAAFRDDFYSPFCEYLGRTSGKATTDGFIDFLNDRSFFEQLPHPCFREAYSDLEPFVLGMSDETGNVGVFCEGSFEYYTDEFHEIEDDELPIDWFRRIAVFDDGDI